MHIVRQIDEKGKQKTMRIGEDFCVLAQANIIFIELHGTNKIKYDRFSVCCIQLTVYKYIYAVINFGFHF